ncbi:MAG: hypothetical protein WCG45_03455 [bacterium]
MNEKRNAQITFSPCSCGGGSSLLHGTISVYEDEKHPFVVNRPQEGQNYLVGLYERSVISEEEYHQIFQKIITFFSNSPDKIIKAQIEILSNKKNSITIN